MTVAYSPDDSDPSTGLEPHEQQLTADDVAANLEEGGLATVFVQRDNSDAWIRYEGDTVPVRP